jgi:hypothetical protein
MDGVQVDWKTSEGSVGAAYPRQSLLALVHWTHLEPAPGSHLIFFSRQVKQAWARRFRGLPALVTPQEGFTGSPSMVVRQKEPSS